MLKAITNITLALVLLVSTTGLVVSEHYCMGMRQGTGMFVHQCGMNDTGCANHQGDDSKGCCEDESEYIDGIELETSVIATVELPVKFEVLIAELPLALTLDAATTPKQFFFQNIHPPPVLRDIPVLLQTFLF